MEFSVNKSKLIQVIWICSKAISWNNTLPVLANILIEAKEWKLYFTATDLDLTIQYFLDAQVAEPWAITIDTRTFQSYLSLLPDSEITFKNMEADISVNTKKSKTKFKWIKADNYPKTLKIEEWIKVWIPSNMLLSSIWEVVFSVSSSNARLILTWVLLSTKWNEVTLTSTDSYRMSHKTIELIESVNQEISVIIPSRTLNEVSKIISEFHAITSEKFNVFITVSENQILFEIWDIKVYSRFIEWAFPNCKMLIPEKHTTQIVLSRADLIQAIKRLSIFAKEDNNKVIFNFSSWNLLINTQTTQIWSDQAELTCSISWEDLNVSLNAIFVLEILNALKKTEVLIETNWSWSPIVFKNPWDGDWYTHIIMPLRT